MMDKKLLQELNRFLGKAAFNTYAGGGQEVDPEEAGFKDRVKNMIRLKVLCNSTQQGKKSGREFSQYPLTEVKYLPKTHQSPTTVYVYGDKTAILMWLTENKPFAILIKNEEIAYSFRSYFHLLWKLS
jgi:hypothetical protein